MITDKLKYFLMFSCPPRSGHTLVASILNAHPNVICSNQRHILQNIEDHNLDSLTTYINTRVQKNVWNPNAYIEPVPKRDITMTAIPLKFIRSFNQKCANSSVHTGDK